LSFRDWIEYVGKDHLHHRLADALGSRRNSVLCIYLMSLCMGVSALTLRNAGPADAVLLIVQVGNTDPSSVWTIIISNS
jgi:UDP-GlcNAc:undecaprenyl-phosphate GlcNAc-1-phosphate transferase